MQGVRNGTPGLIMFFFFLLDTSESDIEKALLQFTK